MQPSANYHMFFEIVDNAETPWGLVRLLDEGWNFIAQNTSNDNGIPLTQGLVGIYIHEQSPSGTVDFTLDNFVAVGTTP